MTRARLSPAEASRLGIDVPKKRKRTRKEATDSPYHTRCRKCGVEFTTLASEDRHLHDTHHARYDWIDG